MLDRKLSPVFFRGVTSSRARKVHVATEMATLAVDRLAKYTALCGAKVYPDWRYADPLETVDKSARCERCWTRLSAEPAYTATKSTP